MDSQPANADIIAAVRHNGGPRRERPGSFSPAWSYEIRDNCLVRHGKIVCEYPPPGRWEAVSGVAYHKPFGGAEFAISPRTEVGLAHYHRQLAAGQQWKLAFKMSRVPVAVSDKKYLETMRAADYANYRTKAIAYWRNALGRYSLIHTPGEPMIEQAHRADAVHVMLGTRTHGGARTQTDGLPYPDLFTMPLYDYGMLYDNFSLREFADANVPHSLSRQCGDGLFWDPAVSAGQKILTSHGQMIAFLANHALMQRDAELGRKVFPAIAKAVNLIRREHQTQPHGLMRHLALRCGDDPGAVHGLQLLRPDRAALGHPPRPILGREGDGRRLVETARRFREDALEGRPRKRGGRRLRADRALRLHHRPGRPCRFCRIPHRPGLGKRDAPLADGACAA